MYFCLSVTNSMHFGQIVFCGHFKYTSDYFVYIFLRFIKIFWYTTTTLNLISNVWKLWLDPRVRATYFIYEKSRTRPGSRYCMFFKKYLKFKHKKLRIPSNVGSLLKRTSEKIINTKNNMIVVCVWVGVGLVDGFSK